jgi:hypothetical protein
VEIDNATYYIDAVNGYSRDEAKMVCESVNMTMISFEGDEQKWSSVNRWLIDNGIRIQQLISTPHNCIS